MTKMFSMIVAVFALSAVTLWAMPAQANPDNPHYCCWQAKGVKPKFTGTFIDQVAAGTFDKCKFKAICNPCDKNLSGVPPDLNLHYCMWQCKGPKLKVQYTITDQFVQGANIETKAFKYILNQCTKQ